MVINSRLYTNIDDIHLFLRVGNLDITQVSQNLTHVGQTAWHKDGIYNTLMSNNEDSGDDCESVYISLEVERQNIPKSLNQPFK